MRAFIFGLALIQFAMPVVRICGGDAQINAYLTNDDTYYYLQTAWNARHLGFVTFDGINATNGVQFLWFSILYALTFLVSDKSTFLAAASTLAVVLTCVPYVIMWRLSFFEHKRGLTRFLAVCMALVWFLICAYRPNRYLTGLESPLHAAIIWILVFQYLQIRRRLARGALRSSSVLLFVALLVMNTWTRLDSFGLSASFLVLLLLTVDGPLHPAAPRRFFAKSLAMRTYVASALVIVCGAATLFAFFQLAGGSLMPVSALVKGYQVDRFSLGAFYNWSLVLFPVRIQGANLLNILGIVAMFASVWQLLTLDIAGDSDLAAPRLIAMALAASVFIHSLVTFGMFRYYYFWYLSATFTYWTIVFSMVLVEAVEKRAWSVRVVAATGFVVVVSLAAGWRLTEREENLASTRYRAAQWMDANLEPDAIVGSFNSGQLGFFSGRSVVNLDGLINNVTYFENILKDPSPDALSAYLNRLGIDYVADYALGRWRDPIERDFTTIQQFDLAGGASLRIMKRVSRVSRRAPAPSYAATISNKAGRSAHATAHR